MKLLIRYIKKQGQNNLVEQTVVQSDTLKIGRGTNQNILLPDARVALEHAKLTFRNNNIRVATSAGKQVLFKQQMVNKSTISTGDSIEILGHVISVLSPSTETNNQACDYIIEVRINEEGNEALKDRFQLTIQNSTFSKRKLSWALFLSIFIFGLILPLAGVFNSDFMNTLRNSPLPDDSQWHTGQLMKSHQFIGDDCQQCHTNIFEQASATQCLTCHENIEQHIDEQDVSTSSSGYNECANCHKEHNPESTLADFSQQMCVSCHEDVQAVGLENKHHKKVTDFAIEHPSFTVSMLNVSRENKDDVIVERLSLADKTLKENSNLNFSHQLHMDPKGIKSATGDTVMACVDCHQSDNAGLMKPITMEKDCLGCHTLTFDAADPERVVPHGEPEDVVLMMREYYAFRYIYQNLADNNGALNEQENAVQAGQLYSIRKARRPGRNDNIEKSVEQLLTPEAISSIEKLTKNTLRSDALVWAETRANAAAIDMFERQACTVCHSVTKNTEQTSGDENEIPWHVEPVVLTKQWLPLANFTHEPHQSTECVDCHQAQESELSSDVLIPDLEKKAGKNKIKCMEY